MAIKVVLFAPEIWLLSRNQTLPVAADEVSRFWPPTQISDKPETDGVSGAMRSVTTVGAEMETQPHGDVRLTV